ncbi:MAG: DegT/DnrJ/EryC1/StrS family aminotransferase [Actinobacteria bacterium]|nr:DegT/DnrJ/EryC1/StrS family aminotransferase [Actinomycetota bacterium]
MGALARVRDADSRRGVTVRTPARAIPLSRPTIEAREEELVLEVLRSGRLSLGPAIDRFEELFAQRVRAPFAAAVSSGTAGLHLAVRLSGVGPGDEVITSPYSFVASANCAIYEGATPVFADIDPRTLNLDPAAVEEVVTERTRAIVAVDIYGFPCELDELRAVANRHGLALVQDACQALGAEYRGKPVGSHGNFAVFAFYPNKQMTTGEGGVVTTGSQDQWELLKSLRNQGRADTDGWLDHSRLGWNYRIDDLSAALGIAQLEKLDLLLALRNRVAARYAELLGDVEGLELPVSDDAAHRRSWFVYVVKLPAGTDRARVIAELEAQGIQTRPYLPSIHLQAYMRERYGFGEGMFPVAEDASRRTLAVPFFPQLDAEDQERVAAALTSAIGTA